MDYTEGDMLLDEENPAWADLLQEIKKRKKVNLSISIPYLLYEKLEKRVRETGKRKSEIIAEALEKFLGGE